jgi:flagellar biosynthesis protein FlhB
MPYRVVALLSARWSRLVLRVVIVIVIVVVVAAAAVVAVVGDLLLTGEAVQPGTPRVAFAALLCPALTEAGTAVMC